MPTTNNKISKNNRGQAIIEYAFVISAVAFITLATMIFMGRKIDTFVVNIEKALQVVYETTNDMY